MFYCISFGNFMIEFVSLMIGIEKGISVEICNAIRGSGIEYCACSSLLFISCDMTLDHVWLVILSCSICILGDMDLVCIYAE